MNEMLVIIVLMVLCEIVLSNHQIDQNELLRIKRQDEELADCTYCGLSFEEPLRVPVIINGTKVSSSQKYPWMVTLMVTGQNIPFCGGAILNRFFILTAAHCFKNYQRSRRASEPQQNGNRTKRGCRGDDCESQFMSKSQVTIGFLYPGWYTGVKPVAMAADLIVHPGYFDSDLQIHDIALIRLANPINCNTHANPICLPPQNVVLDPGTLVKVTGYGQTHPDPIDFAQRWSREMLEATVQIVDGYECLNMGFQLDDLEKMYCLTGFQGETPCFGDSGGSMFGKLYDQGYVTLGVASAHSSSTCDSRAKFVYTSVVNHLPWIYEMMRTDYEGDYGGNDYYDWYDYAMMGKDGKGKRKKGGRSTTKGATKKDCTKKE